MRRDEDLALDMLFLGMCLVDKDRLVDVDPNVFVTPSIRNSVIECKNLLAGKDDKTGYLKSLLRRYGAWLNGDAVEAVHRRVYERMILRQNNNLETRVAMMKLTLERREHERRNRQDGASVDSDGDGVGDAS